MAKSKKSVSEKFFSPFAKAIRELMENTGTTQDELAEKVGKTRQTVSQYVNGISEPGYDTLVKIADYFKVSTDFLLGRTNTKTLDTTAQAVIAYTGLSEDNVYTLHHMKEHSQKTLVVDENENGIQVDGCKPFLDCLNDVLDAVYYDKEIVMDYYIRMRQETTSISGIDFWYINDGRLLNTRRSGYTNLSDDDYVEFACFKIAREIETSLKKKYLSTKADVDNNAQMDGE